MFVIVSIVFLRKLRVTIPLGFNPSLCLANMHDAFLSNFQMSLVILTTIRNLVSLQSYGIRTHVYEGIFGRLRTFLTHDERIYYCAPGGSRTHDRALYLYGLKDRCTGPLCDRCVSNCAPGRDRTYDSSVKSRVLYHLSYERVYFCAIRISANRVTVYISVYISFSLFYFVWSLPVSNRILQIFNLALLPS